MKTMEIKNDCLKVVAGPAGAELSSIKSASGHEYLWQADAAVWPRHAPILFPIVGKLQNGRFTHAGRTYELGQHGFARDMEFSLVVQDEKFLSFKLGSTPATRSRYPFDFELGVNYALNGNRLEVGYLVKNNSSEIMPFSIGAHPGFALNWTKDDEIEDYYLEFDKAEKAKPLLIGDDHLLSEETVDVLEEDRIMQLRKDTFDRDALLFLKLKSRKVFLRSRKSARSLAVEFNGFPDLGIWAKPGARFVCIEPWFGHLDPRRPDDILLNKPGIIKLNAGAEFSCVHRIVVED